MTTRAPGRPRSEQAEKAIIDAVLDVLGEGGSIGELTIEQVAQRAGVGKATIYRRWPGKEELVLDALTTLKPTLGNPPGESAAEDLLWFLEQMRQEAQRNGNRAACIMNLAMSEGARYPDLLQRFREIALEPRWRLLHAIIERGKNTGEFAAEADEEVLLAILNGAMIWRSRGTSYGAPPMPADFPERLVRTLLAGAKGADQQ